MTKFQEAIATYTSFMAEKLEMTNVNENALVSLAQMLGNNIFDADASLVACSDKAELSRVKELFLITELGLTEKPELDLAIKAVCKQMGTANRKKHRVVFYYLLLQQFGYENRYDTKAPVATSKKVENTPVVADDVKVESKIVKTTTTVTKAAKKENKIAAAPVFNTFDETYDFYTSYLYNEVGFFDVQPDLLSNFINTAGENSVVDVTSETESIKNNFLIGRLGCENSEELNNAINTVNERMGETPKYRAIFYYLLTVHLGKDWVITQPVVANLY